MTFDEIWGLDLAQAPLYSIEMPKTFDLFADSACNGSPIEELIDDLDDPEINRFLDWLENSCVSDDTGEPRFTYSAR